MNIHSTETDVHEFACTGPIDVHLRVRNGDVTVSAVDQPVAVVEVLPGDSSDAAAALAEATTVTMAGDRLQVETPPTRGRGWLSFRGKVQVHVSVPVDSTLAADLGGADLRTTGRLTTVSVHSGSGDATIAEAGDLSAESGSGDLRVGRVGGILRAHTGSGDVSVADLYGDGVLNTASGDVEIRNCHAAVRVRSASGDVRLGAVRGHDVGVDSASGDVTVGVPVGSKVWLDLATMSGDARSDLSATDAPEGGAQLTLRVHTMSGDIRVQRIYA